MARQKAVIAREPLILREVKKRVSPILDTRPANAMTVKEISSATNVGVDVIRRKLMDLSQTGNLCQARVRQPRGGYTVVYWLEEK